MVNLIHINYWTNNNNDINNIIVNFGLIRKDTTLMCILMVIM